MATTMEVMEGWKIATSNDGECETRHALEEFGEAHQDVIDDARRE